MSTNFRVFLSKRMKSSADNPMTVIAWNRANKLLACGYHSGQINLFTVTPSRDQPGSSQVETVQTIEQLRKPVTAIAWADNGRLLSAGDASGKVAFWALKNKAWKSVVTNSSVSAAVCSMKWNKSSEKSVIAYQDGNVACVSAEGDLVWTVVLPQSIDYVEWTPHGGNVLCGTAYGEVIMLDDRGVETGTVQTPCLQKATSDPKLVALDWQRKANYGLMIAFEGGEIQLMRNERDTQPIVIKIDIKLQSAAWFKSGLAFAVAGTKSGGKSVTVFLSAKGEVIRELETQGPPVKSLAFDPNDTVLAMAVDNLFCLAQIVPSYIWAFTKNTLLYTYNSYEGEEFTQVFYNYRTGDKRVHSISDVIAIAGHGGHFVVARKAQLGDCLLSIVDTIGITVNSASLKFIPFAVAINGKTVVAASQHEVAVWRFDEEDNPQTIAMHENVSAIHLHEKVLYLSTGAEVMALDIPSLAEVAKYNVGMTCDNIACSSDGSTLSLFDTAGTLQFFSTSGNKIVGPVRREVWSAAWASDTPSQFVSCERQKLFVYNDLQPEEPIQSLSYIAQVADLEILTVDLIRLMQDPLNPGHRIFKSHPTKALREMKIMLANRPQVTIENVVDYVRQEHKNKLWDELAEVSMVEMNFTLAERCYLETTNYRGLQFLKRVRAVKDANIQRAQVLSYLGRFDEAQSIYNSMDRLDLAIEMRASIGDYERVLDIMGPNRVGNDDSMVTAYTNVGDMYAERSDWIAAAESYEAAGNDMKLAQCLYLADDITGLENLMMKTPADSPLMPVLGRMFVSVGAINSAVTAFTSCGDVAAAIDACARLNHWKPALELAGKGKSNEIRRRMNQYANELIDNGQSAAAIDFYVRAGLGVDAAKLLQREGDEILKQGEDYLSAKMCYVFAGLQLEKHRSGAFDGTVTAAERLDGLMKEDQAVTSGLLQEVWNRAEGIHFYLLAHRLMYKRRWIDALRCACRVFDDYSTVIGADKSAALLAVCGMKTRSYGQCSRALTVLEHYEEYSPEKRAKFEDLAIDIFSKNPPKDSAALGTVSCPSCGSTMSSLQSQCPDCGKRVKVCVATGALILDGGYWQCKHCKHYVTLELAEDGDLIVCPLCHHSITS